jgi:sugar lactone lactonase YvrE
VAWVHSEKVRNHARHSSQPGANSPSPTRGSLPNRRAHRRHHYRHRQRAAPHNGVFAPDGDLIFGDSFNQRIRRWTPRTGIITTIAGIGTEGSSPDGAPADSARFSYFGAMAIDRNGDLIWTSLDNRILKLEMATRRIRVIAGTGEAGFGGDGGPATAAQLNVPYGLAIAENGDLIFSDARTGRVRRIDMRCGVIRTISP